jgi:hypothetical protein
VIKIDGLKIKGKKHRKWKSFGQAIKSAWSREEVSSLVERLESLKDALLTKNTCSIWRALKLGLQPSSNIATHIGWKSLRNQFELWQPLTISISKSSL